MTSLPPDFFHTLNRIHYTSKQLAQDLLSGSYRSAFRGIGIEFEEVREYQAGDDTRSIDWNVTARMQHPYVKTFKEERDLIVTLVVDVSSSMQFGSPQSKKIIATEIAAVLAFSALFNKDIVGLLLFSDIVELYLPPRPGNRHVFRIIREILGFKPRSKGSNLQQALQFLGKIQNKRSICFLISDFLNLELTKEVPLISKKHDLIAISIQDPLELKFPNIGLTRLQDLETGKSILIDSSSEEIQTSFPKKARMRLNKQKNIFKKAGASYIEIQTDSSYLKQLRKFFKSKERSKR